MASSSPLEVMGTAGTWQEAGINDMQTDFYGTKLAMCSNDNTVRIFDINLVNGSQELAVTLQGHEGPVFQAAWAHPSFGTLLASCSYDKKVIIWQQGSETAADGSVAMLWNPMFVYEGHASAVNSVAWAPHQNGLMLACGSADGDISMFKFIDGMWWVSKIHNAHAISCNSVSWAPAPVQNFGEVVSSKRIVSGGGDKMVKIWREEQDQWVEEFRLESHMNCVKEVAWAPAVGFGSNKMQIASIADDHCLIIWTKVEQGWLREFVYLFQDPVQHINWNYVGEVLSVSAGVDKISLWKKSEAGNWECISNPYVS
ncbi:unnamed protein product [Orchesella dallaii]|uniref:Protein SEC13 homolog n=1 Tax=Orchesella dallaii TaxID=48710 RepID=A0ABP1PZ97_9HEXA